MASNLHLVDKQGRPLPPHIVESVKQLEPALTRRFSKRCDPAQLSDSIESHTRKIAEYEQENGPLPDADALDKFTWRTLFNGAIDLVRKRQREEPLSAEALRHAARREMDHNPEARLARLQNLENMWAELLPREQQLWILEKRGFNDTEMAAYLGINKNTLVQARHRLKMKLRAKGFLKT